MKAMMKWLIWIVTLPFVLVLLGLIPILTVWIFVFCWAFRIPAHSTRFLRWFERDVLAWYDRHIPK